MPVGLFLLAFCKLPIVGLAVSLADNDTLADRSTREFVDNNCSDPLIPRSVVSPAASNLFLPLSLCRFLGRFNSAVESFAVDSC